MLFLRKDYKAWILARITYPVSILVGSSHNYRRSHLINSNNLSLLPTLETESDVKNLGSLFCGGVLIFFFLPLWETPELSAFPENSSVLKCFWKLLVQCFRQKTCTDGAYNTEGTEDGIRVPRISHRSLEVQPKQLFVLRRTITVLGQYTGTH